MTLDVGTLALRLLFRAAGGSNPIRLLVGVACGITLDVLAGAAHAANPSSNIFKYLDGLSAFVFVLICAPLILIIPMLGKRGAPEGIAAEINTIQALMDRADLPKYRQRLVWEGIITRVAEKVSVPGRKETLASVGAKEIAIETEPSEPT